MINGNLHPDDLLFFQEVSNAMRRVAKQYDLALRSIDALPMPAKGMADCKGDCSHTGDIRLVMRCTVDGEWCEAPRTPESIWNTAAHELSHLRHFNHGAAFDEFRMELLEALQNQQEDHREKVLDKLVKLQRQRESEAELGNSAAAEAFAGAINRMLIEYELNPSDIDYARTTDRDPVVEVSVNLAKYQIARKRTRIAWQESLARIIAKAHLCSFLITTGRNTITFVGTRSHATVAEYVYGTLVPAVEKMAGFEYRRFKGSLPRGHQEAAHGYYAAWLNAFLERITERFDEARKAAVAEADARQAQAEVPGAESMALIRLSGALQKVDKYIDDKFASRRSRGVYALSVGQSQNATGRAHGRAAADKMPIGRKGVTGGKGSRGLLG